MKRLTLIVSGNVQKAGYRDIIIRLGSALGLKGYAENLPDGRVKIVAEGEEKKLELLQESADIKNTLINVEKIESSFGEATGEFSRFYKLVSEGETDERLDRAAELLKEVITAMNQGFSGLNSTMISGFNRLGDGQDKMLERQETTIHILEKVSDDTSEMKSTLSDMNSTLSRIENKQDKSIQLLETINEDTSDMKSTLKDTKFSLSSSIEEKFQKQELEIAEIKATLARMQTAG